LRRAVIQLGLTAWIVFDYSNERRDAGEATRYVKLLDLPDDVSSLWVLVASAIDYGKWDDLEWRSWELGVKAEGEAHFIEMNSYLYLTFLLRALTLIGKGDASPLPDSDEFRYLAAPDGQLVQQLAAVERESDKWTPIIGEEALAAVPALRERLLAAGQKAEQEERQALIDAPIDESKKAEVANRVRAGWVEEGLLRRLAQKVGTYEFVEQDPPEGVLPFGLNQLDTKHAYVTETEVHTLDWGEEYGRSLARGENEMVMGLLQNRLPMLEGRNQLSIEEVTTEATDQLRKKGLKPVILINRSWRAESALERSSSFALSTDKEDVDLVGFFNEVPVYNLHTPGPEEVIVVDLGASFRWTQFLPPHLTEDEIVIDRMISFAVEQFTEEKAEQLIDRWKGEGRESDWTVDKLLERVGLRVFEHFEISWGGQETGLRISARTREELFGEEAA